MFKTSFAIKRKNFKYYKLKKPAFVAGFFAVNRLIMQFVTRNSRNNVVGSFIKVEYRKDFFATLVLIIVNKVKNLAQYIEILKVLCYNTEKLFFIRLKPNLKI